MKKLKKIIILANLGMLLSIPSVYASGVYITSPDLSVNLDRIVMDGTVQTSSVGFRDELTVEDISNSGNGWYVTVHAAPMVDGGGHVLPGNNLSLKTIENITPAEGNLSDPPRIVGSGPYTIDGATPVKIIEAASTEGLGKFLFEFPADALTLTINTNNLLLSSSPYYWTGIYWSVVSGP